MTRRQPDIPIFRKRICRVPGLVFLNCLQRVILRVRESKELCLRCGLLGGGRARTAEGLFRYQDLKASFKNKALLETP